MANRLIKKATTTIIPADPGVEAVIGQPYIPSYYTVETIPTTETFKEYILVPGDAFFFGVDYTAQYTMFGVADLQDGWFAIGNNYFTGASPGYTTTYDKCGPVILYAAETVYTYHPGQPAIASVAGVPPTEAQVSVSLNKGWNTWARSIEYLAPKQYYLFRVPYGSSGVFIGLDVRGKEGAGLSEFRHGLMIDISGVHLFESGEKKSSIAGTFLESSRIRISRQDDNTIVYGITVGEDTTLVTSAISPTFKIVPLYVYGYLYQSGDEVSYSKIKNGEVNYGEA